MNVWDVRLVQDGILRFEAVPAHALAVVVLHGPFVMNSRAEILEAFEEFENGRFGLIPA